MGGRCCRRDGHPVRALWSSQIYSALNHGRDRAQGQRS